MSPIEGPEAGRELKRFGTFKYWPGTVDSPIIEQFETTPGRTGVCFGDIKWVSVVYKLDEDVDARLCYCGNQEELVNEAGIAVRQTMDAYTYPQLKATNDKWAYFVATPNEVSGSIYYIDEGKWEWISSREEGGMGPDDWEKLYNFSINSIELTKDRWSENPPQISIARAGFFATEEEAIEYGEKAVAYMNLGQFDEIPSVPDWNQMDENGAGYIKNRTHWYESEILEENLASDSSQEWFYGWINGTSCGDLDPFFVKGRLLEDGDLIRIRIRQGEQVYVDDWFTITVNTNGDHIDYSLKGKYSNAISRWDELRLTLTDSFLTENNLEDYPSTDKNPIYISMFSRKKYENLKKLDPIYIPNPDWNENDESLGTHVKNRTHWIEPTWDGEPQSATEQVVLPVGYYPYRVAYDESEHLTTCALVETKTVTGAGISAGQESPLTQEDIEAILWAKDGKFIKTEVVQTGYIVVDRKDEIKIPTFAIINLDLPEDEFLRSNSDSYDGNCIALVTARKTSTVEGGIFEQSLYVVRDQVVPGSEGTVDFNQGSGVIVPGCLAYSSYSWGKKGEIVHKLDVKYLPDNIGTQPDWNESDENSNAFIKNKTHYAYYSNVEEYSTNETIVVEGEAQPMPILVWEGYQEDQGESFKNRFLNAKFYEGDSTIPLDVAFTYGEGGQIFVKKVGAGAWEWADTVARLRLGNPDFPATISLDIYTNKIIAVEGTAAFITIMGSTYRVVLADVELKKLDKKFLPDEGVFIPKWKEPILCRQTWVIHPTYGGKLTDETYSQDAMLSSYAVYRGVKIPVESITKTDYGFQCRIASVEVEGVMVEGASIRVVLSGEDKGTYSIGSIFDGRSYGTIYPNIEIPQPEAQLPTIFIPTTIARTTSNTIEDVTGDTVPVETFNTLLAILRESGLIATE